MRAEVSMTSTNSYEINWTKLYPILFEYQSAVDCEMYHRKFTEMAKEMMTIYKYSLDDKVLVLKDLLHKSYLEMQKEHNSKR
ncbi:MAG: helix-turn-helix domain protein [Anaerosolibacter sp.]|jgi:hypothetical protein|uniref:hypothetical protein n=1 Tax=Anaerosolibacter sp. TaxID=1872527 RepID=UPI00262FAE2A|nr:hypothetical protein [Anaerosolibacter sp.]MDF2548507.1 helix-turn-helix domain protein [Anaerosolibacter sp.]